MIAITVKRIGMKKTKVLFKEGNIDSRALLIIKLYLMKMKKSMI